MHYAIGGGLLVFVLIFVFGKPAARVILGSALLIAALAFMYVAYRVVTGSV